MTPEDLEEYTAHREGSVSRNTITAERVAVRAWMEDGQPPVDDWWPATSMSEETTRSYRNSVKRFLAWEADR